MASFSVSAMSASETIMAERKSHLGFIPNIRAASVPSYLSELFAHRRSRDEGFAPKRNHSNDERYPRQELPRQKVACSIRTISGNANVPGQPVAQRIVEKKQGDGAGDC